MSVRSRLTKAEDELTGLYRLILYNPQDYRTENIRENRREIKELKGRLNKLEEKEKENK